MYSYHLLLLPLAVVALVVAHILLVRKHGIVPPFQLPEAGAKSVSEAEPESVPGAESAS
jgi:ubiquinol-cytochrome c reductase cytochrome b subunit